MIAKFFIDLIFGILDFLVALLPNPETLPEGINDAFEAIAPFWGTASRFFPIAVVFTIFSIGIAIELGILSFKVANWAYDKIRGSG